MLRGSVLCDQRVVDLLSSRFVNAWVLARDLPQLARDPDAAVGRVSALLQTHYTYPVDSIVIGPKLEVLGQLDVDTAARAGPAGYVGFLRKTLPADGKPAEVDRKE